MLIAGGAIWFVSQFYFPYIPTKMAEQAELIAPYFADEDNKKDSFTGCRREIEEKSIQQGEKKNIASCDFKALLDSTERQFLFEPAFLARKPALYKSKKSTATSFYSIPTLAILLDSHTTKQQNLCPIFSMKTETNNNYT